MTTVFLQVFVRAVKNYSIMIQPGCNSLELDQSESRNKGLGTTNKGLHLDSNPGLSVWHSV